MFSKQALTVVFLPAVFFAGCLLNKVEIYDPPQTAFSHEVGLGKVRQEIHGVLQIDGWAVEEDLPGFLLASRSEGSKKAQVRINYSQSNFDLQYVSSVGFDYRFENDKQLIQSRYNEWVKKLQADLENVFSR